MAVPTKPQKKTAYGTRRLWLVDTIANPAAPTDDEIAAGDYIACYPLSDQGGPVSTPNKVNLPVLMCETESEEQFGTTVHTHPDLVLLYDPQAAAASAGKKAWDIVKSGYTGYIVWELGEPDGDETDVITAGDFVTVVPAEIRVVSEEPTSTGEDGLLAFQATVRVRSPYTKRNVAVVAAP